MGGHEEELTAALRARYALGPGETVLAAWSGYLHEFRGGRYDDKPPAILGVATRGVHLLSSDVCLSAGYARLRGPHAPYVGYLRFAIAEDDGILDVGLYLRDADAIARQLDLRRREPARRAVAKQRPSADYVS